MTLSLPNPLSPSTSHLPALSALRGPLAPSGRPPSNRHSEAALVFPNYHSRIRSPLPDPFHPFSLGDLNPSAISSTGSMAATGAMLGSAFPIVGTAIGAAVGAAVGFVQSLFGSSKYHMQEAQATRVVNQIESEMKSSYIRYKSSIRTFSRQQAALAYFDQLWSGIIEGCTALGTPGNRCVSERQRGGASPWCCKLTGNGVDTQYTITHTGPCPTSSDCCTGCDEFTAWRDPIQFDSGVIADPGYVLVVDSSGNLAGEWPEGEESPGSGYYLLPPGSKAGDGPAYLAQGIPVSQPSPTSASSTIGAAISTLSQSVPSAPATSSGGSSTLLLLAAALAVGALVIGGK